MADTRSLLLQAVALHQAGRLADAAALYDRVLLKEPKNADALNLKAVILDAHGQREDALALFERAIAANAKMPEPHFNRANVLATLERHDDALAGYERAIALRAAYPEAHLNAALLLRKLGRGADARAAFARMAAACPADARAHHGLGDQLAESATDDAGLDSAQASYDRALQLAPNDPHARFALANLLARRGRRAQAIDQLRLSLKINPDWPEAFSNLGEWLKLDGRFVEAVAAQRSAVALRPDDPALHFNLADSLTKINAHGEARQRLTALIAAHPTFVRAYVNLALILKDQDEPDAALDLLEAALDLDPTLTQAYANIAAVFVERGWFAASLSQFDKALALKPDDAPTRFYRGIIRLLVGQFEGGWDDYNRRFDVPKETLTRRAEPPPYWKGEPLAGRTLLVWSEQGIGDEILYAGMLGDVVGKAQRSLIECSDRLVPIFERSFPGATVFAPSETAKMVKDHGPDFQIAMPSLGGYLRRSFASFPKHAGYLKADATKVQALRERYLAKAPGNRLVGISWRSKSKRTGTAKSLRLLDLAPILKTPGVTFVNLQYGDCGDDLAAVKETLGIDVIHDVEVDPLKDMEAAFAQVGAMDLVISTSNTTAHTAGAQNTPVWVVLPYAKGVLSYWLTERSDNPWYPSARLFRQGAGDPTSAWADGIVARIAGELNTWASGKRP